MTGPFVTGEHGGGATPSPIRIAGIDPGCYGALALLIGDRLSNVVDMPFLKLQRGKSEKAEIDGYALGDLFRAMRPDIVVVEAVGGMTGQSAAASFNFGRAAGAPEYAAKALGLRVERVHPITWKRALKINGGKDGARDAAMRLWPGHADRFARVKDDGRAEAALIAEWFRRSQTANPIP
jgi:crossover junction endodeoxyribonuclease RuvC